MAARPFEDGPAARAAIAAAAAAADDDDDDDGGGGGVSCDILFFHAVLRFCSWTDRARRSLPCCPPHSFSTAVRRDIRAFFALPPSFLLSRPPPLPPPRVALVLLLPHLARDDLVMAY